MRSPSTSRRTRPTARPSVSAGSEKRTVRDGEAVERRERRRRPAQDRHLAPLEPPLLPEVEGGDRGGEREPGERGEHEADVQHEEDVRVVAPRSGTGAAARARDDEQRGSERHDREAEQPVRLAHTEIHGDDEPHEEVERPGPRSPRESVLARGLDDEQRGLREPAEPHAPDRCAVRRRRRGAA